MRKSTRLLPVLLAGIAFPILAAASRPAHPAPAGPRLDRSHRLLLLDLPPAREVAVEPERGKGADPYPTGVTVEPLGGIAPAVRAALRHDLSNLAAGAGCPADQRLAGLLAPQVVQEALGPGWESELGVAGPPEDVLTLATPELAAEVARLARGKGDAGLDELAFLVTTVSREPTATREALIKALGLTAAIDRLAGAYRPGGERRLTTGKIKGKAKGKAAPAAGRGDASRAARLYEALRGAGRKAAAPDPGADPQAIARVALGDFAAGDFPRAEAGAARLAALLEGRDAWVRMGTADAAAVAAAIDLFGRMDSDERWGRLFEEGLLEVSAGPLAMASRGHRERYLTTVAAARLLSRYHGHGRDGPPLQVEVTCGPLHTLVGSPGPGGKAAPGLSPRLHLSPVDLAKGGGHIALAPKSGEAITVRLGWWGE